MNIAVSIAVVTIAILIAARAPAGDLPLAPLRNSRRGNHPGPEPEL